MLPRSWHGGAAKLTHRIHSGVRLVELLLTMTVGAVGIEAGSSSAPTAARPQQTAPLRQQVVELLRPIDEARTGSDETSVALLVRLGPRVLPILFDVYAAGQLPELEGRGSTEPLNERQESVLSEGMVFFGRSAVHPFLLWHAEGSVRMRKAILGILERVGDRRDLGLALEVSSYPHWARADADLLDHFMQTVEAILQRDASALNDVGSMLLYVPPDIGSRLVGCVSVVPSAKSLEVLAGILGVNPRLDVPLLRTIGVMADRVLGPVDETVRTKVRKYLSEADPAMVREAALAAGKLEDHLAVPLLVRLLDSNQPLVAENSHCALRTISGQDFSPDRARWTWWATTEQRWYADHTPGLFRTLKRGDLGSIVDALNQLSSRRYRREEIAEEVVLLLWSDRAEMRRRTCSALGQLGATAALPELVRSLEDDDEAVRRSAWRALRSITGADLPLDSEAWRTKLLLPRRDPEEERPGCPTCGHSHGHED